MNKDTEEIAEETLPVLIQGIIEKAIFNAKDAIVSDIVAAMDQRFAEMNQQFAQMDRRVGLIESVIATQSETMDRLFKSFDKVLDVVGNMIKREVESSKRLNDIENRLAALEQDVVE